MTNSKQYQVELPSNTEETNPMDFTIKSPYPQAYIVMETSTGNKSWQFKGSRIYVDYKQAKKLCDKMNRYIPEDKHIVVGFDLVNGGEMQVQGGM